MNQRALAKLGVIIIINMIYILINVVSLGLLLMPSTSALFHFLYKIKKNENEHFEIVVPFIRKTFELAKKTFLIQIVLYILFFIILFNFENLSNLNYSIFIKQVLSVLYLVFMVEIGLIFLMSSMLSSIYVFKNKSDLIKMSVYILHRHILTTTITIVLLVAAFYLVIIFTWVFIFLGLLVGVYYFIDSLYAPIFAKYIVKEENTHGT